MSSRRTRLGVLATISLRTLICGESEAQRAVCMCVCVWVCVVSNTPVNYKLALNIKHNNELLILNKQRMIIECNRIVRRISERIVRLGEPPEIYIYHTWHTHLKRSKTNWNRYHIITLLRTHARVWLCVFVCV